jgi:hypothetical protein
MTGPVQITILGARDSIEHFKKLVKLPWKNGVRGLVLSSPKR